MENQETKKCMNSLKCVLNMALHEQEIKMLENINPEVEYLMIKAVKCNGDLGCDQGIEALQAVLDITWEELNTGHWSLVPEYQRAIYSAASLLKVVILVQQAIQSSGDSALLSLQKAVESADMGLLLGNSHRDQLTKAASLLSEAINSYRPKNTSKRHLSSRPLVPQLQVPTEPIKTLHCPSLETFFSEHFSPRVPVKITGCMNHWTALDRWTDLNYLLQMSGSRTVPVELGSSYSSDEWSQRLMTLHEFITQHIRGDNTTAALGYLAQHQLFDQVPELRKDIAIPDYCGCSEEESEVDINAWFGPAGTVSPLHYDPKHNLLCQVVGEKRVILYAPSSSDCLYPHEGRLLANTAQVDPEEPDYNNFPKYRNTQALHCTLSPGEMLYIPPLWWHHVRALAISFSVSFWWT